MRGQGGVEFVLLLGAVIAILAVLMTKAYIETELTTAFAAARLGAIEAVSGNSSLAFTTLNYTITGRNVTIRPGVYFDTNPIGENQAIRASMLKRMRDSFSPSSPVPSSNFSTLFHDYYVAFP